MSIRTYYYFSSSPFFLLYKIQIQNQQVTSKIHGSFFSSEIVKMEFNSNTDSNVNNRRSSTPLKPSLRPVRSASQKKVTWSLNDGVVNPEKVPLYYKKKQWWLKNSQGMATTTSKNSSNTSSSIIPSKKITNRSDGLLRTVHVSDRNARQPQRYHEDPHEDSTEDCTENSEIEEFLIREYSTRGTNHDSGNAERHIHKMSQNNRNSVALANNTLPSKSRHTTNDLSEEKTRVPVYNKGNRSQRLQQAKHLINQLLSHSREKEEESSDATSLAREKRRQLAYRWYLKNGMPDKYSMLELVSGSSIGLWSGGVCLTEEDVHLLPWTRCGSLVDATIIMSQMGDMYGCTGSSSRSLMMDRSFYKRSDSTRSMY